MSGYVVLVTGSKIKFKMTIFGVLRNRTKLQFDLLMLNLKTHQKVVKILDFGNQI